jgi:hypothetical protein
MRVSSVALLIVGCARSEPWPPRPTSKAEIQEYYISEARKMLRKDARLQPLFDRVMEDGNLSFPHEWDDFCSEYARLTEERKQ